MNSLRLDVFDECRIREHIDVGAAVYSSPEVTNVDHLRWKHLQNPYGPSSSISMRNEANCLVGRSFIQPRTFWANQCKAYRGAIITDLVVVPEERNAATMIAMTRAIKSPAGFDVIVHTSNNISDLIYRKLFKFPVAFTMAAIGLPIRTTNALRPYLPNSLLLKIIELLVLPWRMALFTAAYLTELVGKINIRTKPVEDEISKIFEEYRQHVGAHFERNQNFLRWRFTDGPIFDGEVLWMWKREQCLGYLVFKKVTISGHNVLVIMDAVLRRRLSTIEAIALKFIAVRQAIVGGHDAIFTMINTKNLAQNWLAGLPYINIPDRYLPHSTPIFVHASQEMGTTEDRAAIFFTLADLDYF